MLSLDNPGVYIEEIDSGAKPIEVAGTSTAAFLGYTRTGDAMVPVPLENYESYRSLFGGVSKTGNETSDSMAFAVRAFFQNGGRLAYIINVARGGKRASVTFTGGRNNNPPPLFVVESKHDGSLANGFDIYLTPKNSPSSGEFDLEIVDNSSSVTGPVLLERYPAVTLGPGLPDHPDLAPGLPNSLDAVVKDSNSRFVIRSDAGLRRLVFPTTPAIAISDLKDAGAQLRLKVNDGAPLALNVDWPAPAGSAEDDVKALKKALDDLQLPPGIRVVPEPAGNDVHFVAETMVEAAKISVLKDNNDLGSTPNSRGELMHKLVTGAAIGEILRKAVLSAPINIVDPAQLQGRHLDVRIGTGLARRIRFRPVSDIPAAKGIAKQIEDSVNADAVPAALQSLDFEVRDGRCQITVNDSAPKGAKLSDATAQPLFDTDGGVSKAPRILDALNTLAVTYDEGTESDLKPSGEVKLDPTADKLADLEDRLKALKKQGGSAKLLEVTRDGFALTIKAKSVDRPVTFTDDGTQTLATILGLSNKTVTDQEAATTVPLVTPNDLTDLTLQIDEDGAAGGQAIAVDLTTPPVTSSEALRARLETTLKGTLDNATADVRAELVKDRYLIWDPGNDVEIPEPADAARSAAGLLSLTAARGALHEPLNVLQQPSGQRQLALSAELSKGDSGQDGNLNDYEAALAELESRPEVSIICLPGHPWDKGSGSFQIVEAAIMHAKRQQDRMVIVDPPKPNGSERRWRDRGSIQQAELPTSSYAAVYYPWVLVPVPTATPGIAAAPTEILVAPSGFAAGIWSRTDRERGVWKAPAGVDTRVYGASKFQHDLTDAESGALNREGINALRNLRGWGPVVWGSRTAATNAEPQWKYLPVRRTAIMIEDSLRETLAWAVHQPNRPQLWSALRLNIEAFLNRLFEAGAFQPDNPKQAYFVQCGLGTTMSQADIDAGLVRVRIGIAPSKPAEFVIITIEQISERG